MAAVGHLVVVQSSSVDAWVTDPSSMFAGKAIWKERILNLSFELLCKTPNEAVIEIIGSMLLKYLKWWTERCQRY